MNFGKKYIKKNDFEKIKKFVQEKCDVFRMTVERGNFDPEPLELNEDTINKMDTKILKRLEEIIEWYSLEISQKSSISNRFIKDVMKSIIAKSKLYQLVYEYSKDGIERQKLLKYYIKNNLSEKCLNMYEDKCGRYTDSCRWQPGTDKLGQWAINKTANERNENDPLPEYVGPSIGQKPKGCYPVQKVSEAEKGLTKRKLRDRELKILQNIPQNRQTEKKRRLSKIAEDNIKEPELTSEEKKENKKRIASGKREALERLVKYIKEREEKEKNGGKKTRKKYQKKKNKSKRKKNKNKNIFFKYHSKKNKQ